MKKVSFYVKNKKWEALSKELKRDEKSFNEWFQEVFDKAVEKYLDRTKAVF